MQIEIIRPKNSAYESLGPDAQGEVNAVRASIFYRWPTPNVPAEGKLEWDDDLAVIYVHFGVVVLLEAMTWFRQNAQKRPSIPEIRERCRTIRESKASRSGKPEGDPRAHEPYGSFASYDRALNEHLANPDDARFVPFSLLYRDAAEFNALKRGAQAKGERVQRADVRDWWLWRTEATDREWAEARREAIATKRAPGRTIDFDNLMLSEILRDIA